MTDDQVTPPSSTREGLGFSLDRLTKLAAVLGAFIAVAQTGTEYVRGFWQRELDTARAKQELVLTGLKAKQDLSLTDLKTKQEVELARIKENSKLAEDYIKLIVNKDISAPDRNMLLAALSNIENHPLREWAKNRLELADRDNDALKRTYDAYFRAIRDKSDADQKIIKVEFEIDRLNVEINRRREDPAQITLLHEQRRQQAEDLAKLRATVSLASAKLEGGVAVAARLDTDQSSGKVVDKARAITALVAKIDAALLRVAFPDAPQANLDKYLPFFSAAFQEYQIADKRIAAITLATIAIDSPNFEPSIESEVSGSQREGRVDLGNVEPGDGVKFRGRGFFQIVGRFNYRDMSNRLGLGSRLVDAPDDANSPEVAARIACAFIMRQQPHFQRSMDDNDLRRILARIQGGADGLEKFSSVYQALVARL
jgi:hypothetical protein